jgi:hypothetical protein
MAVPKVKHVKDKVREMGPTVAAPEDVIGPGPTESSGVLLYRKGDPMPVNEAVILGYLTQAPAREDDEQAPKNASVRGRKVRVANRLGTQHEDESGTV